MHVPPDGENLTAKSPKVEDNYQKQVVTRRDPKEMFFFFFFFQVWFDIMEVALFFVALFFGGFFFAF